MSDMSATLPVPGDRDFGDGVSESPFGQDAGADGTGRTFRDHTQTLRDQATDKLHDVFDQGKRQVTDTIDGVVAAAREIAGKLDDGSFGPIGGYAHTAADTIERLARTIKDKSPEELFDDGRDFARANPAVAVGLAVVAGFALTRIFRAGGR